MPFRDGTGPQGMGPMTGRGAGYCATGNAAPRYTGQPLFRRWPNFSLTGWNRWFAPGRGFRRYPGYRRW